MEAKRALEPAPQDPEYGTLYAQPKAGVGNAPSAEDLGLGAGLGGAAREEVWAGSSIVSEKAYKSV